MANICTVHTLQPATHRKLEISQSASISGFFFFLKKDKSERDGLSDFHTEPLRFPELASHCCLTRNHPRPSSRLCKTSVISGRIGNMDQ